MLHWIGALLFAPVAITFGVGLILGPGFGQFARWFDAIVPWARYMLIASLAFALVMLVVVPLTEYRKRNRFGRTLKSDRHDYRDKYGRSGGGGWIGGGPAGFGSFGSHSGGGSFGGGGASGGW